MLKIRVISNNNITVLNVRGKRALADVNCYCKKTSAMLLDGVTSFLRLKDVINNCERMRHSLTHLAYRANAKKRVISNNNITVLKVRGKRALADVNCYCKMTSVMALDGVTSFLRLKDVIDICKRMRHSLTIGGISSVQWRKVGRS